MEASYSNPQCQGHVPLVSVTWLGVAVYLCVLMWDACGLYESEGHAWLAPQWIGHDVEPSGPQQTNVG